MTLCHDADSVASPGREKQKTPRADSPTGSSMLWGALFSESRAAREILRTHPPNFCAIDAQERLGVPISFKPSPKPSRREEDSQKPALQVFENCHFFAEIPT